ncbi:MAG: ABC-F family ATP-binding cassette domain-containing protein [Acidobacteria bacterium]|nr:ABC-F family ATP-binding cassette domain-containing protein [Acidobacteriota bacterium]
MIQLSAASKRFGSRLLFEDFNWLLTPQDRVGLVGGNGTGKSTLLKILAGIEHLDEGTLSSIRNLTTGYLPQDGLSASGRSVLEEALSVFGDLHDAEREMEVLTLRMGEIDPEGEEFRRAAERYHKLEIVFNAGDGYQLETQAKLVLDGLGFRPAEFSRDTQELSGGWQMRLALAKCLLLKPHLLLLDEPTNHLDLEARNWLESFLHDYPHAVVLVSHDRYFLDASVNRILELWNRQGHFYPGNYEQYLERKSARREQLLAEYRQQRERIDHLEIFINRFRYQASKARQVQSRIKELEKIERIEIPPDEQTIRFSFPQPPASGRVVTEFADIAKRYDDKQVFSGVNFMIRRGERIGLVGTNGAGKSTLIKLLAGTELPSAGECKLGHNVEVEYFAQDQYKMLNPQARLIDDLSSVAPIDLSTQTKLRTLLGCFLFTGDDVFKPIGVLSGGERNRFALARMLLQPPNFLLLDEPTNHLDLRAKDVLLDALQRFSGTIVFVSHDRYFIDHLATRIFEIENGKLTEYDGNYENYLRQKEGGSASSSVAMGQGESHPVVADPSRSVKKEPTEASSESPRTRPKRLNPILVKEMRNRHSEIEEEIIRCEAEIADSESALAQFKSAEETIRLTKGLESSRFRLSELMGEWEQLSIDLDEQLKVD